MRMDELPAANASVRRKLKALRANVAAMAAAKDAEARGMRKRIDGLLADNGVLRRQLGSLQSDVSRNSAVHEAEVRKLRHQLGSVHKKLHDAEADSKRLTGDLEAHKIRNRDDRRRAEELSLKLITVQEEKEELNKVLSKQIESVITEIVRPNKKEASLNTELDDAEKMDDEVQRKLNEKIVSLEEELFESKKHIAAKSSEVNSLQMGLRIQRKCLAETVAEKISAQKELAAVIGEREDVLAAKDELLREIGSRENKSADAAAAEEKKAENPSRDPESAATRTGEPEEGGSTRRETGALEGDPAEIRTSGDATAKCPREEPCARTPPSAERDPARKESIAAARERDDAKDAVRREIESPEIVAAARDGAD